MSENLYTDKSIRTFTGSYVNVFDPNPETLNIEDIAWALSKLPRFGGHYPIDYSVAMHSLMASDLASDFNKLEALMHDSSEAYLADIPSPIKAYMPEYKKIESHLMSSLSKKFGFNFPLSDETKQIDKRLLELEWNDWMKKEFNGKYLNKPQTEIYQIFLDRFEFLTKSK